MSETTKQLFIITASNPDAAEHVEKSISCPIDPALCQQYFDASVLDSMARNSRDANFYAWGAVPGQNNLRNWERMQTGDHVLLYQKGQYTFWSTVIAKQRNADFATALWGKDENGETWELVYSRGTWTRYTPVGTSGGLSSRELIDNPKWIPLHIGRTARTTLVPPKTE